MLPPLVLKYGIGNFDNLQIDKDLWLQTVPSERLEGSQMVKVNIKEDLYDTLHSIRLKVEFQKSLKTEFLAPYWKIIEKTEKSAVIENNMIFVDESVPLKNGQGDDSNPFLKQTPYIQISLPTIQQWKRELLNGFRGSRMEMAQKILAKVSSVLIYDEEGVKNNIIRALKTEEILQKKNGVCQHFANLFTTLARSVGLPTRIISGFLFSAKSAGPHAWVEVEIRPGVWRPLEPQDAEVNFITKRYFPVTVSATLDDPSNPDLMAEELKTSGDEMSFQSL